MKLNRKRKVLVLIIIGTIFSFLPFNINNPRFSTANRDITSSYNDDFDYESLRISTVSGPIYIDDYNPSYNWSVAKGTGICTGNGTYLDPYVIEDLVINVTGSVDGILIGNSSVFFRIENCTIFNSDSVGILLANVNNSKLINNDCSDNGYGIGLYYSNNNTLSGNTANEQDRGIYIYRSNGNILDGNTINNNNRGLYIFESSYNNITGNFANSNSDRGIALSICNESIIQGNTLNYNSRHGIRLSACINITITGNTMNGCGLYVYGSLEELSSNLVDVTNLVNGKTLFYYIDKKNLGSTDFVNAGQVFLINCTNSVISNLNTSQTSGGILLLYSNYNTVSGNIVDNNVKEGITLSLSNNNTISGNTVSNSDEIGIFLEISNNNTITGNIIKYNGYGLYLGGNPCSGNEVFLNCFISNADNAQDDGSNNAWDNGNRGNHWSDYTGADANDNGIGDTPYIIGGTAGSGDFYPLTYCVGGSGPVLETFLPIYFIAIGAFIATVIILRFRQKKKPRQ